MNIAVITGASSGLGKEFYRAVTRMYPELDEIWLIARRKDRMEALARESLGIRTVVLPLDLTKQENYNLYRRLLETVKPSVFLLINNAGFGKLGNLVDEEYEDQMTMVDLNDRALTALTCITLPYVQDDGLIVNTASIAAFAPNPRMTVYSATKAFILSFSKSLREELKPRGINVLAVCPGPMDTEFLDVANIREGDSEAFRKLPYCDPAKVAQKALLKGEEGKAVYTPKVFYKFYRVLAKLLPHNLIMKFSKT